MMKYVAMHYEQFQYPGRAFFMGWVNCTITFLVEVINLWNLSNITEGGTYSLMFDFIALGIIAEFDEYFIELYAGTQLMPLLENPLKVVNVKRPKR